MMEGGWRAVLSATPDRSRRVGINFAKLKAQIYLYPYYGDSRGKKIKDNYSFPFYQELYRDLKINQIKVDG
jgi:hypothetical protein